jgi:hypothetical protein
VELQHRMLDDYEVFSCLQHLPEVSLAMIQLSLGMSSAGRSCCKFACDLGAFLAQLGLCMKSVNGCMTKIVVVVSICNICVLIVPDQVIIKYDIKYVLGFRRPLFSGFGLLGRLGIHAVS